jgi:hypothetical protein
MFGLFIIRTRTSETRITVTKISIIVIDLIQRPQEVIEDPVTPSTTFCNTLARVSVPLFSPLTSAARSDVSLINADRDLSVCFPYWVGSPKRVRYSGEAMKLRTISASI